MNALALRQPRPVTLNADGKVTAGYETIEVALPPDFQAKVAVQVGWFPDGGQRPSGWWAEARLEERTGFWWAHRLDHTGRSASCRERRHAVCDAVDNLVDHLVDAGDHVGGNRKKWFKGMIAALSAWSADFGKQKESTAMTIAKATKVLTSKECKFLLEDFRRSYESFQHSFLQAGEGGGDPGAGGLWRDLRELRPVDPAGGLRAQPGLRLDEGGAAVPADGPHARAGADQPGP